MNILDLYKDQKDYLNIKLKSEAFEDGQPFFYKEKPEDYYLEISEIHKVLYRLDKSRPLSINIYYESITEDSLDEIVELHKEWFPFSYDRDFYKKFIARKNNVAVGAFLKIGGKAYLIGCALGEMVPENKFKNLLPGVIVERSWYDVFSSYVECGYLYSIGVIDEYRHLSVGTRLLELFVEEMKKRNAVVIYLNIICHNNAAIKFIEANSWHFFGIGPKYYKYKDNLYDSKIYYYILDMSWCNIIDVPKDDNKDGIIEAPSGGRGCLDSLFGGFFGGSSTPGTSTSTSTNNDKNETNKEISSTNQIKNNENSDV